MHDVEGAKLCGLDSLGVYTGFAPEGELEEAGATYVFHTIKEMADFLAGYQGRNPQRVSLCPKHQECS